MAAGLIWASTTGASAQEIGVAVAAEALPPAGAAYRGVGPHLFLDGRARLTCGSHGHFTSAVEPPRAVGGTVVSDYVATFVGELVLEPPLVPIAVTHPLAVEAQMVERITLASSRRGRRLFDTELVTLDLRGSGMPAGVMVRESPSRPSMGRTTLTSLSRDRYRVESFFDVWLEISLDSGRSWHPARAPVRMSLERAPRRT